ncbi:MAG TPA: hypothetical protein VFM44_09585 [Gemmatimonadota bacterium]|nr:hypothetical protein [Gemmatimonadota bacterium]
MSAVLLSIAIGCSQDQTGLVGIADRDPTPSMLPPCDTNPDICDKRELTSEQWNILMQRLVDSDMIANPGCVDVYARVYDLVVEQPTSVMYWTDHVTMEDGRLLTADQHGDDYSGRIHVYWPDHWDDSLVFRSFVHETAHDIGIGATEWTHAQAYQLAEQCTGQSYGFDYNALTPWVGEPWNIAYEQNSLQ